jgi:hypothetical protein
MAGPAAKTIFVHIPKTAGMSLREVVREVYPGGSCIFIYSYESLQDQHERPSSCPTSSMSL